MIAIYLICSKGSLIITLYLRTFSICMPLNFIAASVSVERPPGLSTLTAYYTSNHHAVTFVGSHVVSCSQTTILRGAIAFSLYKRPMQASLVSRSQTAIFSFILVFPTQYKRKISGLAMRD